MKYLKKFENNAAYETAESGLILPNVSLCVQENEVHYKPYVDPCASEKVKTTYEYVDLGLPSGLKWATKNIGALSETDTGLYFQWADIDGYTYDQITGGCKSFKWDDYKYSIKTGQYEYEVTKYTETDGKTIIEPIDDAAIHNMGGSWHMPTINDYSELINSAYTTTAITTVNGVTGLIITSTKVGYTDKYVFFPTAGYASYGSISGRSTTGKYWAKNISSRNVNYGLILDFSTHPICRIDNSFRDNGLSIRGVMN